MMKKFNLYPIVNGCSVECFFTGTKEECAVFAKNNFIKDYILIDDQTL